MNPAGTFLVLPALHGTLVHANGIGEDSPGAPQRASSAEYHTETLV